MSTRHIVLGLSGPGPAAKCWPVYVGNSGAEAQQAMAASPAPRFEIFSRVVGLRKNNPNAAANAAAQAADAAGPVAGAKKPRRT